MNANFIKPIVETAYTEEGLLIVITRAERTMFSGINYFGWLDDIDSHMDKRIIEYAQNGAHSYKEWDEFLKPLGYVSLWEQDFGISEEALEACRHRWNVELKRDDWSEEITEQYISERIRIAKLHYNDSVEGIEFHTVPKGSIFRFVMTESRDEFGEYDGEYESIDVFQPEEFVIAE